MTTSSDIREPFSPPLHIIGGGLAGCEAAWQAAQRGIPVRLYEMKPEHFSPAHRSPNLGELVCSNSLRSDSVESAVGLLKEELRLGGSLLLDIAAQTRVPAGKALAVDRERFSGAITASISSHPLITVVHGEVAEFPAQGLVILATGPLTSEALASRLKALIGDDHLYFYDAIAPIIYGESVDRSVVFRQSRYAPPNEGDYLNCPMDRGQYERFLEALLSAEKVPLKSFEKGAYFEGCLPIEVMAERGPHTLRFGPMKPVGLTDPRTGQESYAVVQLRQEDLEATMYNLVGFQTKLKWQEQERVFRLIPGLERAEFARLGSIHRNTFVCGPKVLNATLQLKADPHIMLAGQISGVEGYVESTSMGWLAGVNASRILSGQPILTPPPEAAHGALLRHISQGAPENFQPMNVNFGLFPALGRKIPKKERGRAYAERALAAWREYLARLDEAAPSGGQALPA